MTSGFPVNCHAIQSVKCVIVGDGMVGKSCLLNTYLSGEFYTESSRTKFDVYPATVMIDNNLISVDFWDTSGVNQYVDYRCGIYPQTDVFLVCFSIESHLSLGHVKKHWNLEVRNYCPNTPIILVGTQIDLREGNDLAISYEEGSSMAKKIGAIKYMECSALTGMGLRDLFVEAIKAALLHRKRGNSSCCILF